MGPQQNIDIELEKLSKIARRMDALVRIPKTNITIGLDSVLGLIPGIGDGLALAPALYIVWSAKKLGASTGTLTYMLLNVVLDFLIGLVPLVGDLFDVLYNANIRNVRALERNLDRASHNAALAVATKPIASD